MECNEKWTKVKIQETNSYKQDRHFSIAIVKLWTDVSGWAVKYAVYWSVTFTPTIHELRMKVVCMCLTAVDLFIVTNVSANSNKAQHYFENAVFFLTNH